MKSLSSSTTRQSASSIIDVSLEHFQHTFAEQTLQRYGSPHFSTKEAGEFLRKEILSSCGRPVHKQDFMLRRNQILCANEVFPEAAVSDPLADLEIWDEWRAGLRAFPFPGKYSQLGIVGQDPKTASTTSMGVLGEVLAGLFAQSYIDPFVIVRPIRRWPDFIFFARQHDGRYAFVESKAFMMGDESEGHLRGIPSKTLADCLVETVHQLNSDPFVRVWLAFSGVLQIQPMRVCVTLIELETDNTRRQRFNMTVPIEVIRGLSEQCLHEAAAEMVYDQLECLTKGAVKNKNPKRREAEKTLQQLAEEKIEEVLMPAVPKGFSKSLRADIVKEIHERVKKAYLPESPRMGRYAEAKNRASGGVLAKLRAFGEQSLFLADLPHSVRATLLERWKPDWRQVLLDWTPLEQAQLWRCSSAVLTMTERDMEEVELPHNLPLWMTTLGM